MRVEHFNPNKYDQEFEQIAIERLVDSAEVVVSNARSKCPVGTISRPIYKTGPYAGQPWTARDAGQLKKTIRVTRKKTRSGKAFSKKRSVRIYAGSYIVYYASIVEHTTPFLRPAFMISLPTVKQILGAK